MRHCCIASLLCLGLLALAGCAAGHGPHGEVILGVDLASLPENASEALGAAAQFLPPPWGLVATGVLGLLGTAATTYAAKKSGDAKAATDAHAAADKAWDESHIRTAAAYGAVPGGTGSSTAGLPPSGDSVGDNGGGSVSSPSVGALAAPQTPAT